MTPRGRHPTCAVCGIELRDGGVEASIPLCSTACSEALERPTVRADDLQQIFQNKTAPPPGREGTTPSAAPPTDAAEEAAAAAEDVDGAW